MTNLSLPDDTCEWCGATVKYVRVLNSLDRLDHFYSAPIDAAPRDRYDDMGTLCRVPRRMAAGRIDCAIKVKEAERWRLERTYSLHRDTCPQRHKWNGPRKLVEHLRARDLERANHATPELDVAGAIAAERAAKRGDW